MVAPGVRDTPCHLPATHPARLWHMATHWKCLMISEGSVISLGMWVTISVRATWGKRRGKGICRTGRDLQDIMLPPCPPSSELGHQLPPQRQVSTDLLNAQSETLRAQPDNAIPQTDGYSRASVSKDKTARERDLLPGCPFIQKLVKISYTFPCQPSSRLFLKTSVPIGTSICAKQEVVN